MAVQRGEVWLIKGARERLGLVISSDVFNGTDVPVVIVAEVTDHGELRDSPLSVERLMGLEVPERAVWLRTALAELNRVLNHLMFLGSYPLEIGAITPVFYAFREREVLQAVMEEASGGRMHYMFNRVGGLKEEVPAGWTKRARVAIGEVRRRLPDLDNLIRRNDIFLARTRGVGVLSAAAAAAYGASGPVARASGLDFDLRRDEPYLAYGSLSVPVVTRK